MEASKVTTAVWLPCFLCLSLLARGRKATGFLIAIGLISKQVNPRVFQRETGQQKREPREEARSALEAVEAGRTDGGRRNSLEAVPTEEAFLPGRPTFRRRRLRRRHFCVHRTQEGGKSVLSLTLAHCLCAVCGTVKIGYFK